METNEAAEIYNKELITWAAKAEGPQRLDNPDASAHAVSVICGSEVTVDLNITDGKVTDFGFEVEACALTKTALVIIKENIIGKNLSDIQQASKVLEDMLSHNGDIPQGDWADFALLEPVKDYTARHNSIMLSFKAIEKAFKNYPLAKPL
jgi:NifU-like protein involved in Fe-S cluster formation